MEKVIKPRTASIRPASLGRFLILLALLPLAACAGQAPGLETPAATIAVQAEASPTSPPLPDTSIPPTLAPTQPAAVQSTSAQTDTDQAEAAEPLPDCTSPAALTPSMTEGPYYTPGSPERSSLLEEGMAGTKLTLTGYVLTADCQPIPNAWLDFWQADAQGQYDNAGYRLRGHQFTDESGRYRLETVVPGLYPGRTAHIHVKVQAPDGPVLTSQIFFPDEPGNQTDSIFSPQLLVDAQQTQDGMQATFNFVVDTR